MSNPSNGKGDRRRKGDNKKYRQNYAQIFEAFRKGMKEEKKSKKGKDKS
jgi:hypothetical protein